MKDLVFDLVVVRLLQAWILLQGMEPIDDFEARNYGPHRVLSVCAKAPPGFRLNNLNESLSNFLDIQNLIGIRPGIYSINAYRHHNGHVYLYIDVTTV